MRSLYKDQIDLDLIRRTEYVPPSERNMNSSSAVHQMQPQAYHHLHHHQQQQQQQHHYQRQQQGCGRQHDRDWEGAVGAATPPTGLQRPRGVAPRSVAGASPTVSDARPRRPPHKHPDHAVAPLTTTRLMEKPQQVPVSRALVSSTSKCPIPKWPATIKTMEKVPSYPPRPKSKQQKKNSNQERPKNLVGFHHHQSATAACYLGSMTDGSSESGGVYGVYSETKYVYAVNKVPTGNPIQASAAAAFFAR
nr:unnamed protein product [Callosobruchus chinensis]